MAYGLVVYLFTPPITNFMTGLSLSHTHAQERTHPPTPDTQKHALK